MINLKQLVGWGGAAILVAALGACSTSSTEVLPAGGNSIPTPIVGENVGMSPESQAASAPEETVKRYLKDSIAGLVAVQTQKITLRQRYQNPDQTKQDLGGLLTAVNILEDRTKIKKANANSTSATANADIDVRVTWADGDTQSFSCKYALNLQAAQNANQETVWYVINPDIFPIFATGVCVQK